MARSGIEPRPLALQAKSSTTRPPSLPILVGYHVKNINTAKKIENTTKRFICTETYRYILVENMYVFDSYTDVWRMIVNSRLA